MNRTILPGSTALEKKENVSTSDTCVMSCPIEQPGGVGVFPRKGMFYAVGSAYLREEEMILV